MVRISEADESFIRPDPEGSLSTSSTTLAGKITYECREMVAILFAWLCLIVVFDKGSENSMVKISIIIAPKAWKVAWGMHQNARTHTHNSLGLSGAHTLKKKHINLFSLSADKHTHTHTSPLYPCQSRGRWNLIWWRLSSRLRPGHSCTFLIPMTVRLGQVHGRHQGDIASEDLSIEFLFSFSTIHHGSSNEFRI